ncbi:DUF2202 domain-containing protein [Bacteroidota bacterium]
MKNLVKTLAIRGILATGLVMAVSCEQDNITTEAIGANQLNSAEFQTNWPDTEPMEDLSPVTGENQQFVETEELTIEEKEMLSYMIEEEKLARDVYYTLYDIFGDIVFSNISKAEEKHISAIEALFSFYNLESYPLGAPGEFQNAVFNTLYGELIIQGSGSLEEALKVGALIEELDINDLKNDLHNTENQNITLVFSNLLKGSESHLRAFNKKLVALGVSYEPQYITLDEFEAITSIEIGQGRRQSKSNFSGNDGECTGDSIGNQNQYKGNDKGQKGNSLGNQGNSEECTGDGTGKQEQSKGKENNKNGKAKSQQSKQVQTGILK